MVNPRKYFLTGLLLEFWDVSDKVKLLKPFSNSETYRYETNRVVRAAKQLNHEALCRLTRKEPIPFPWEGDGSLE